MLIRDETVYRCPKSLGPLKLLNTEYDGDLIKKGTLMSVDGREYAIENYIPDLTYPPELQEVDNHTRSTYDKLAEEYDKFANIPFETFGQSNHEVREKITSKLELKPNSTVLDIGAGDGRGGAGGLR